GVSIDIDQRRQAEQGLRDAEERYRALFEHSPYGVMILDPIGRRIVHFNAAAHRQLGYPRHYFGTLWLDDLAAPEDQSEIGRRVEDAMQRGGDEFETRM